MQTVPRAEFEIDHERDMYMDILYTQHRLRGWWQAGAGLLHMGNSSQAVRRVFGLVLLPLQQTAVCAEHVALAVAADYCARPEAAPETNCSTIARRPLRTRVNRASIAAQLGARGHRPPRLGHRTIEAFGPGCKRVARTESTRAVYM